MRDHPELIAHFTFEHLCFLFKRKRQAIIQMRVQTVLGAIGLVWSLHQLNDIFLSLFTTNTVDAAAEAVVEG